MRERERERERKTDLSWCSESLGLNEDFGPPKIKIKSKNERF